MVELKEETSFNVKGNTPEVNAESGLDILYQISNAVVSKRCLEEILSLIVTLVAQVMDSRICSLMLVNEKQGELDIKATQSLSPRYRDKPPTKIGQSVSGLVVQTKKALQVLDVRKDARFKYPDIAREEGLCSLLSVPMLMGEKVIGVLNCYTQQEKTFQEKDIQLLVTISNQAAIAIEHVNLLDEQIRLKESIEARKLVERAKGILMKRCNISEDEAYRFIQKKSMDNNKPLKEVAEALLLAEELKPF